MWTDALAAHEAGRVRVTEARAADFVGPQVPAGALAPGPAAARPCAPGRRAWVVGDPDAPRSWAYLPDVAATLATLGTDERAWAGPGTCRARRRARSGRRSATWRRRWACPPVPVSGIPWPVLRAVGLVVPMMREVVDVRHQFDQEFVIDATRDDGDVRPDRRRPWDEVVRPRRPRGGCAVTA